MLSWEMAMKNLKTFGGPGKLEKLTQSYRYYRQSLMASGWLGFFALGS